MQSLTFTTYLLLPGWRHVWVRTDPLLEETQADRGRLAGIKSQQSEAEMRLYNLKMKAELTPELRKTVIIPRMMPVRIRRELGSLST